MPSPLALTPRAKTLLVLGLLVLVGLSVHRMWWAEPPGPYVAFGGQTMGTTWEVKLAGSGLGPNEIRTAAGAAEETLAEVVALMSNWEPDSEISRFNAHPTLEPFAISAPTLEVVAVAERFSQETDGAFDITVGALVEAWGFGPDRRPEKAPDSRAIEALRKQVGFQRLEIIPEQNALRKSTPALQLDLSAIAKGYGVDRVAEALEALGHSDYLIEVGGELRAAGRKRSGQPWRVAIERPSDSYRAIQEVLDLNENAMATSGDYRNFYEEGGRRFSHTLDPRSGAPISHALASVTVVDPSAMQADAWATALNVLGPEEGYSLASQRGVPAYFIIREGSGFSTLMTEEMSSLLRPYAEEPAPQAP